MPVIINGVLFTPPPKPKAPGRPSYNEKIKKLPPAINEARENGHLGIREMVNYLNARGVLTPSGKPFSYSTLRDILMRLEELRVIDGPRSISEAGSNRRCGPRVGTASGINRGRYPRRSASRNSIGQRRPGPNSVE